MRIVHSLVPFVFGLAKLLGGATPALAGEPLATSLPRPAGLPDGRTYAGAVFTTGLERGHVVISEGPNPDRPARWVSLDDDGRTLWEAEHTCPNFNDLATLLAPAGSGRVVCKLGGEILGVDVATGAEAWRFTDPAPLYMTVTAGGRVAVSLDNAQVAVLDGASGREVARFDVAGGVLEAAADTARGPVGLMVVDSPTAVSQSVDLPTGPHGELEAIALAGDDPGRRLVAFDIGGPERVGVTAPVVRWSTRFAGYSFDLEPSNGVVIGRPNEGRTTAFSLDDGHVLWERPLEDAESLAWGEDGGVFARRLSGGGILYGALDARRGKTLWTHTAAADGALVGVGQGGGDLGVAWERGFVLAWFARGGAKLGPLAFGGDDTLVGLRSTARSVLWVTARGDSRTVRVATIGGDAAGAANGR